MLRIRLMGMTLVAVLAFSGVASAHLFSSTVTGSVTRVTNGNQTFNTGGNQSVVCTTDKVSNSTATSGNVLSLTADISYSGCTVTVLGIKFEATVTTAKYLISADLLANLTNTVVIKVPVAGCDITIKPQNTLKAMKYKNTGKNVVVEPNVTSIKSEGSGGECGGASSTGTYTGNTEVSVAGGTISWS
jgi:hypothetical protein